MNLCLRGDSRPRLSGRALLGMLLHLNRPEPQRIHHRHRPRAHGENIAQNSSDSGGRSLKWFDERRMIVRFDLEGAGPAVANVDDARIFSRALQHAAAVCGQPLEMHARRFVRAVLAPHDTEDAEFGKRRLASAEQRLDSLVFVRRQPVTAQGFGGDSQGRRGGHGGKFYCRIFEWRWVGQSQKHFTAENAEIAEKMR